MSRWARGRSPALRAEAGDPAKALELLDRAHIALAGGLGLAHPQLLTMTLDRADLAWELGDTKYAARLYANRLEDPRALHGAEDPRTLRAQARSGERDP